MSILAINTLENNVAIIQNIYLTKDQDIIGIRVKLLKVGTLTNGTITMIIKDGSNVLSIVSKSYIDFNSLGSNWYGFYSFLLDNILPISKNSEDTNLKLSFEFKITSHTNSDSNYLALVHEEFPTTELHHLTDQLYYPTYGDDKNADVWNNPYGIEVYSLK